jgi:hypothetical protein
MNARLRSPRSRLRAGFVSDRHSSWLFICGKLYHTAAEHRFEGANVVHSPMVHSHFREAKKIKKTPLRLVAGL